MTKSQKKMLSEALELSRCAHKGQVDKGGTDYFEGHITNVVSSVEGNAKIVAALHDVLEDTDVTESELREKFPAKIIDAVVLLTHRKGEPYSDYIARIKTNSLAIEVKLADLNNNMNLSRIPHPTKSDYRRVEKYKKAVEKLQEQSK